VGSLTQWRGQSDTSLGRFGWGFLMSLLLHLPLTPLAALFGLLTLLTTTKPPTEPLPELTGIPVDLLEGEEAEVPPPAEPPPPAPEPVAIEPPAEKPERHEPEEPKIRDAGVSDAEPRDAAADADAAIEGSDAGAEDGGITDPVAASGAERVADVNANVQIKIFTEKIREHSLAPRVSQALASVPQWRDFFGPAALDPVKDIDRLLIAGPQLRDSSEVAVVAKVNVSQARVREAIDGIVRSDPKGAWLDAGVPAASARVDRAERVFVNPSKTIVVVAPPSAAQDVIKHGKKITLKPSSGPEVVTAKLVTPWRAFRHSGVNIDIPKSITSALFKVTPDEHGGVIIEIIAKDESAEKAQEDAAYLERLARSRTQLDLGFIRMKFVERIVFTSKGDEIHGYALVTAAQLRDAIGYAMDYLGASRRSSPRVRPGVQERLEPTSDAGAPTTPKSKTPKSETPTPEAPSPPSPPAEPTLPTSPSPPSE
jgi:hypothetical protein